MRWVLPRDDYWSTPFAEALLAHLDLSPGLSILDVASGHGIPAFYLAEQVGPSGRVLSVDLSEAQMARARAIQGRELPWLTFECADMRQLPPELPSFDRLTGNLSVMFMRPDRLAVLRRLASHVKPGGQLVLTFPSQGTFESLWRRIDRELIERSHQTEREKFHAYLAERPSAREAQGWLETLGCRRIVVAEWPLEVASGSGQAFLHHPLLRGGFLDDVYECFEDQQAADSMMAAVADDLPRFTPLIAQRCVMAGWTPD
jgi:SAM-dependent methyltransferase